MPTPRNPDDVIYFNVSDEFHVPDISFWDRFWDAKPLSKTEETVGALVFGFWVGIFTAIAIMRLLS